AGIEPRLTRGRRRAAAAEAPPRRASRPEPADWATAAPDGEHCHWCHSPAPAVVEPDTRCPRFGAPLAPPTAAADPTHDPVGRLRASRRPRGNHASMQRRGGGATLSVRLRDLCVTGIGLVTTAAVPADTRVRIQSQDFEAIAVVV